MYLVVEYVLDERVKLLLRLPRPKDYTKELHWIEEKEELHNCLTYIAKKHKLDITNEEHLEELDSIVDIISYEESKLPSDLLK